jgi:hypothetical protein
MKYNDTHIKQKLALAAIVFTIGFIVTLFTTKCNAQMSSLITQPVYRYYFIETRLTTKSEVELVSEKGMHYAGLDSIVNNEAGKKDNVHFLSYSEAFSALSNAGLEFMEFRDLASIGGTAKALAGDEFKIHYAVWRKRIQ